MKWFFSFILLMNFAFARDVNFRRNENRIVGDHRLVLASKQCDAGAYTCKLLDREGIVRVQIGEYKNSDGDVLVIFSREGKVVSITEDSSVLDQMIYLVRNEMRREHQCRLELLLNNKNRITESTVKCSN